MNSRRVENLASIIIDSVVAENDVRKVFLFGSFDSDNETDDSDIDLCFVTGKREKRKIEVIRDIRTELVKKINRPMDIIVCEENEFRDRSSLKCTLEYQILKHGRVIYEQTV